VNTFSIIGVSLAGVLMLASIWAATRKLIGRRAAVAWAVVWLAAGTAIAYPGLTAKVARALGIGRGADLVFYCGILAMLVGFFMIYARLRRIESDLTRIVRHIALEEAPRSDDASAGSDASSNPERSEA
jgi:hypothetical protein